MPCDAQSLMDLAASRGYGKLSHRQLAECWLVVAANSAPSTAFAYTPATSIITWTDINGAGQSGDLAFFNANADKASVTVIGFDGVGPQPLSAVTNIQDLPALQTFVATNTPATLAILDFSGMTTVKAITISQSGNVNSLNLTGCTGLLSLNCDTNQLASITGLSTCTALTTFIASNNLFIMLNLNFLPAHIDTLDVSHNPNLTSFTAVNLISTTGHFNCESTAVAHFSFPVLATVGGPFNLRNIGANTLTISLPNLTSVAGAFTFADSNALTSCSVPLLSSVGNGLLFDNNFALVTQSFPALISTGTGPFVCDNNTSLTSISIPNFSTCGSDFSFDGCAVLPTVSAPALNNCNNGQLFFTNCPALATISLPALPSITSAGPVFIASGATSLTTITLTLLATIGGDFLIDGCTGLVTLSIPALTSITGTFDAHGCTSMVTSSFPAAPTFNSNVDFHGNTSMMTLNLGTSTFADNAETIDFAGCALSVGDATHGVDGVLNRCVMSTVTTLTIDLSGGTNASPSPAGLADKAALIAAGNTCATN